MLRMFAIKHSTNFSLSNLSDGANFNAVTITLESMILSGGKSLILQFIKLE